MANLLIVDGQGRRRVQIELEAAARGHKSYSSGNAAEAATMITIYVPEAILAPDRSASKVIDWLQESGDPKLKRIVVVSASEAPQSNGIRVERARNGSAASMLDALEVALAIEE